MESNSTSMYIEMRIRWYTEYEYAATLSEVVKNNLHADGIKFNIHVHRNEDKLIYRVRKDEYAATLSEVVKNNLHPNGTKFNIHACTEKWGYVDIQSKKIWICSHYQRGS